MQKGKLPKGWSLRPLSEVCLPKETVDPRRNPEKKFIYVDISSIDNNSFEIKSQKELLGKEAPSRARKVVRSFDTIFATTRPYLRGVGMVPPELNGQVCSTGFCVIRPDQTKIIPKWAYYFAISEHMQESVIPKMRGASYPAVTDKDVYDTEIPLPPLEQQKRIVSRIEELTERIDKARRLRAAANQEANTLMEAALKEVLYSLYRTYENVRIGNNTLASVIAGQHIMAKDYSDKREGIPYLTGPADFGQKYPLFSKWTSKPKVLCQPGDILFTVKGSGVGKVNMAPSKQRVAVGRQIMAIRPNRTKLIPDYLFFCLLARFREFQDLRQGAAIPGIRKEHVEAIEIPLPPKDQQKEITAHLDSVQKQVDDLKRKQAASQAELESLIQSILAKAFRGELVPTEAELARREGCS